MCVLAGGAGWCWLVCAECRVGGCRMAVCELRMVCCEPRVANWLLDRTD